MPRQNLQTLLLRLVKRVASDMGGFGGGPGKGRFGLCPSKLRVIGDALLAAERARGAWVADAEREFQTTEAVAEQELLYWGAFLAHLIRRNGPLVPRFRNYVGEGQNIELAARLAAAFLADSDYDIVAPLLTEEFKRIWSDESVDLSDKFFDIMRKYY